MDRTHSKDDFSGIRFNEVQTWLYKEALPFWEFQGFDPKRSVCRESLAIDGAILDPGFHRIRALSRQIYVFSHAQLLEWKGPAASIADQTADFLIRNAWQGEEKGWARKLDDTGRIIDETPDLYDQAFALFAMSWRYQATGDRQYLDWARKTLHFITLHMSSDDGLGYKEFLPPTDQRIQNPHMHMLEALLVLARADNDPWYLNEAHKLIELFTTRIMDQNSGAVREFFAPGWQILKTSEGAITEPGHLFEWVWILNQYQQLSGVDMGPAIMKLFNFANKNGIEKQTGLTFDQVRDDGRPLKQTFRSWPQTETLKALLAMGERSSQFDLQRIAQVTSNLLDYYLDTTPRGFWVDQLDEKHNAASEHTPSSTFYHIFLAFSELVRLESKIIAQNNAA